jgi:thiol:disulfide interchange protein DsbD
MKTKILFIVLSIMVLGILSVSAQILKPVKWSFTFLPSGHYTANQEQQGRVILTADIQKGWHIYAEGPDNGDGPIPTSFKFEKTDSFTLTGGTIPRTNPKVSFDPTFKKNIGIHEGKVVFEQKVSVHKGAKLIKGSLEFMVCNDRQCLPPKDLDFEIKVN